MLRSFELFSGAGGAAQGLKDAGYTSLGAIDYHQPAVDIYNLNHETPATCQDILDVHEIPSELDLLWMSPSCKSFSVANVGGKESDLDIRIAKKLADLIGDARPRNIAIENVVQYRKSLSLEIILDKCRLLGYKIYESVETASDYGAPTRRSRLIVRLTSNSQLPLIQRTKPNIDWYGTIEHIVGDLAYSELTQVQKNVMMCQRSNLPLVIQRCGYHGEPNVYPSTKVFPTITSHAHHDGKGRFRVAFNLALPSGKVKVLDYKALGLIQGFPITYNWGYDRVAACMGIGNSVSPPLAKAVAESFRC